MRTRLCFSASTVPVDHEPRAEGISSVCGKALDVLQRDKLTATGGTVWLPRETTVSRGTCECQTTSLAARWTTVEPTSAWLAVRNAVFAQQAVDLLPELEIIWKGSFHLQQYRSGSGMRAGQTNGTGAKR